MRFASHSHQEIGTLMTNFCPTGAALRSDWLKRPMKSGVKFKVSKEWPVLYAHMVTCAACNYGMIGTSKSQTRPLSRSAFIKKGTLVASVGQHTGEGGWRKDVGEGVRVGEIV